MAGDRPEQSGADSSGPGDARTTMTLAFELEVLERLSDPVAVVRDARRWSTYLGIVSDEPAYFVQNYIREHDIPTERLFFTWLSKRKSLESVKGESDTDRHVFVGTTDEAAAVAEDAGWEYLPVAEAAAKADWQLAERAEATG